MFYHHCNRNMAGRPLTRWTNQQLTKNVVDEVWYDEMMEAVGEGQLEAWCKQKKYIFRAVRAWINEDEKRKADYEAAEKARAARMIEECLEISDGSGDVEADNLSLMRDKLRIDTRMKVAKALDRKYGDQAVQQGGPGNVTVILTDFREKPAQLVEDLGPNG